MFPTPVLTICASFLQPITSNCSGSSGDPYSWIFNAPKQRALLDAVEIGRLFAEACHQHQVLLHVMYPWGNGSPRFPQHSDGKGSGLGSRVLGLAACSVPLRGGPSASTEL